MKLEQITDDLTKGRISYDIKTAAEVFNRESFATQEHSNQFVNLTNVRSVVKELIRPFVEKVTGRESLGRQN